MPSQNELLAELKQDLKEDLIEVSNPRERRVYARIKPAALRKTVKSLKNGHPELRFMTISTIDHGLDFEFLHHFHVDGAIITIKIVKPKEDNTLESIADIIPAANFIEREVSDLFGLKLIDSPQPEPLILGKNWPDNERPLRKPMEGELPPQARPTAEALITLGCVAPVSTFMQKKREDAGLPRTPAFAFTDDKGMNEYRNIMKDSGLQEKVGYDPEKKRLRYK